MQVFLCGSGAANHQIAQALHGFLGDVIQDLEPFLSSAALGARDRKYSRVDEQFVSLEDLPYKDVTQHYP